MNRFPKRDRIKRGADFSEIIRRGAFAADDVLVVNVRHYGADSCDCDAQATKNAPAVEFPGQAAGAVGGHGPRLGITIPRKTGPAVVRNRWKRWIREAFRTQRSSLPEGIEIIVRPKRDAVGSFAAIAKSLRSTVRRAEKKLRR